jgi:SAM-dependent methyltransferase
MENGIQQIACVGCESLRKEFFGKKNGFSLYKCSDCGMVSLYEKPVASAEVYSADYFSGGGNGFGYVNYDEDKEPMRQGFYKYLSIIENLSGKKGKLFDVGAATGFFIALAKEKGFEVSGVELSSFAANKAREKGFDVATGTLESIPLIPNSYEVVTMLDVIEHMMDPEAEVKIAYSILKKDGLLVINTPNSGSTYAKLMGIGWHLVIPPEHIHYFNRVAMRKLLERNGFEVLVETTIGKKFTFEYVCNMLFKWLKIRLFQTIAIKTKGTWLGTFSLPINLRDNMFVVARKINERI